MKASETSPHEFAATEFASSGYFVARALFAKQEVEQIQNAFMTVNVDGPVEGLSEIVGGEGGYDASDPLAFYPRMMQPHHHLELSIGPIAEKTMLDARLHGYLRAFMDDEPVAVQSMFYFKPPGARGQELHQDNYYLKVKPGTCVAAWLALDDADIENGGMKVVPGSHEMEIACPERADTSISFTGDYVPPPPGLVATHVNLKAGDVLFFNGSVIHGSSPNLSQNRFRRSIIFHYIPLSSSEVGRWYGMAMTTFDGRPVHIAEATGGGPCGTSVTTRPH